MWVQDFKVPAALRASRDLAEVMEHGEIFLMVIPTPFVATTMNAIKGMIKPHQVQPALSSIPGRPVGPSHLLFTWVGVGQELLIQS
jgi:hypothetical protein